MQGAHFAVPLLETNEFCFVERNRMQARDFMAMRGGGGPPPIVENLLRGRWGSKQDHECGILQIQLVDTGQYTDLADWPLTEFLFETTARRVLEGVLVSEVLRRHLLFEARGPRARPVDDRRGPSREQQRATRTYDGYVHDRDRRRRARSERRRDDPRSLAATSEFASPITKSPMKAPRRRPVDRLKFAPEALI